MKVNRYEQILSEASDVINKTRNSSADDAAKALTLFILGVISSVAGEVYRDSPDPEITARELRNASTHFHNEINDL